MQVLEPYSLSVFSEPRSLAGQFFLALEPDVRVQDGALTNSSSLYLRPMSGLEESFGTSAVHQSHVELGVPPLAPHLDLGNRKLSTDASTQPIAKAPKA